MSGTLRQDNSYFFVEHNRINNNFQGAVGIFTPDNQKLITVAKDLYVRLWSAKDGSPIDSFNIASDHAFGQQPIFSADGLRILIPLQNGQAYIGTFTDDYSALPSFDKPVNLSEAHAFIANSGKVKPLLIPLANVSSGTKLQCEDAVLLGSSSGEAAIYDLISGELLIDPISHNGVISSVASSADGNMFATGSNLGTIKIWDRFNLDNPILVIGSHDSSNLTDNQKISFSADAKSVWTINEQTAIKWNLADGKKLIVDDFGSTQNLSFSSSDGKFTALTKWHSVKVYDNENHDAPPFTFNAEGRVDTVCFSKDNQYLVTGTANGKVRICSTLTGEPLDTAFDLELASSTENIDSITVNDNFSKLAVGCKSGQLYVIDINLDKRSVISAKRPKSEVFRSEIIDIKSETRSVDIDIDAQGAKKIFLVVEDGGNGWYHDKANWIEPKLLTDNGEINLTELKWVSASTNWGEVQIGKNVAKNPMSVDNKIYNNGIGTHGYSVIEYNLPEGVQKFTAMAGLDDQSLNYENSQSCVRFSIYLDNPPGAYGNFSSFPSVKGTASCTNVKINSDGNLLAATFTEGKSSYAQVWDLISLRPISDKLSNEKSLSNIDFLLSDFQVVAWNDSNQANQTNQEGIATVWDVSIRNDLKTDNNYPGILKALGKQELNEDSLAIPTKDIDSKLGLIRNLESETLINKFLHWQNKFPSQRGDSPFRTIPSEKYIKLLSSQNEIKLLNEAVRISPNHALTMAKRGAIRLTIDEYPDEPTKALALKDVTRALLLEHPSVEVLFYVAIVHEYLGNVEKSEKIHSTIQSFSDLKLNSALSIIHIQETLKLKEENRRKIFDHAITLSKNSNPELMKELIIKRFMSACEYGNYLASNADWQTIIEWDNLPPQFDAIELTNIYLKSIENESDRLVANQNYESAIALLKPAAIASLADPNSDNLSSLIAKLIEWEYRENPPVTLVKNNSSWHYLDDGSDPGVEWFEPWATTKGWSKGIAKLGYGGDGENTVLQYGDDVSNKHLTYYFRHEFNIEDLSKSSFLTANVIRDDGVIVYLNGKEVIRDNMDVDAVNHLTQATATAGPGNSGDEIKPLRFSINSDFLEVGKNVMAAEIHQIHGQSSDVGFQLELLGSNYKIKDYVMSLLVSNKSDGLFKNVFKCFTKDNREKTKNAFWAYLNKLSKEEEKNISTDQLQLAISIAEKLKDTPRLKYLADTWVNNLDENPSTEDLTLRAAILNETRNALINSDGSKEDIIEIEKKIVSPTRKPNLSNQLIDLSDHYNASLFHYSNWHSNHENFDMRFLPEKYNGSIEFDLRGVIQLNSGLHDDGRTTNDWGAIKGNNKQYPNSVENIKINSKAQRAHFLVGAIFGHGAEDGEAALNIVFNYSDGSKSEMTIKAKQDIFDWWSAGNADNIPTEMVGFLGENYKGHKRFLTKPIWENPHPEKIISHIDLNSGLIKMSPFIVGITIE